MKNEFNEATGSWPEKYFFADKDGRAIWKSPTEPKGTESFDQALRLATDKGWIV